jgi:di/tricarboxylate transporter
VGTALALRAPVTLHQAESFLIVAAMLVLFASGRLRYDVVAATCLLAAVLLGVVPADHAFRGFSNPVIIIIGAVLVVSRAIAASNLLEVSVGALLARVTSPSLQIGLLSAAVGFLSAFVKNVGTLGIFMPLAIQAARRGGHSRSSYLMPLAFASLVGGTITKIGTSPNLLISNVREELGMPAYGLFDFAPVGFPLTVVAVIFVAIAWRVLPRREGVKSAEDSFSIQAYTTELRVPAAAPSVDLTVADVESLAHGDLSVAAILRENARRYIPAGDWRLYAGDVLVVIADPTVVHKLVAHTGFEIAGRKELATPDPADEMEVVEVIVAPDSMLVGQTPASLQLRERFGVNLFAVRQASHVTSFRLRAHHFVPGDVVLLQGWGKSLAAAVAELGVLPLADRKLALGRTVSGLVPIALLGGALALVALHVLAVEVAFFAAAVLTVLLRQINVKEAYAAIEWPVIVMLACLIPVGEGLRETGATGLIAQGLTHGARHVSPEVAVGLVMATAMLLTPLLHHAAAVLVLGPVAAAVATNLGLRADPFLMAVALGCACDFLTPIGHQNNALVMGPGGYRFGDYWRLGLPLTLLLLFAGTPLIVSNWPLH